MTHESRSIAVWDPFLRLMHWGLAAAFFIAYFNQDTMSIHTVAGYTVFSIIVLRLIWGFIGSGHARFSDFVRPPSEVIAHVQGLLRGDPGQHEGHNPLAGWVFILMFVLLAALCITGMATLAVEEHAGPLVRLMSGVDKGFGHDLEEVHEFLANAMLFVIGVHLTGALVGSLMKGENLARTMITGYRSRKA